jgi:hypothetical protein
MNTYCIYSSLIILAADMYHMRQLSLKTEELFGDIHTG